MKALLVALVVALLAAACTAQAPPPPPQDCETCLTLVDWVLADMAENDDSASDALDVVCSKGFSTEYDEQDACQELVAEIGAALLKALDEEQEGGAAATAADACQRVEACAASGGEAGGSDGDACRRHHVPTCSCVAQPSDGSEATVYPPTCDAESHRWQCPSPASISIPDGTVLTCMGDDSDHHGNNNGHHGKKHGHHGKKHGHHDRDDDDDDDDDDGAGVALAVLGAFFLALCLTCCCACVARRQRTKRLRREAEAAALAATATELGVLPGTVEVAPAGAATYFAAMPPPAAGAAGQYMPMYPVLLQTPNGPVLAHPMPAPGAAPMPMPVPMPMPMPMMPMPVPTAAPAPAPARPPMMLAAGPGLPALQASQHLRS